MIMFERLCFVEMIFCDKILCESARGHCPYLSMVKVTVSQMEVLDEASVIMIAKG